MKSIQSQMNIAMIRVSGCRISEKVNCGATMPANGLGFGESLRVREFEWKECQGSFDVDGRSVSSSDLGVGLSMCRAWATHEIRDIQGLVVTSGIRLLGGIHLLSCIVIVLLTANHAAFLQPVCSASACVEQCGILLTDGRDQSLRLG